MNRLSCDLSVSVVVHKSDIQLLIQVLDSVYAAADRAGIGGMSIDIVDNYGEQALADLLTENGRLSIAAARWGNLKLIRPGSNLGYGKANNLSINKSTAKYHLVLNPDAILDKEALAQGLAYLEENPGTGLLVPRVLGFDGKMHFLCKRNPTLLDLFLRGFAPGFLRKLFRKRMDSFEMRDRDYERVIQPVEYPTGCFMLFRREILRSIGGFDESFFLYMEDADIGRRILKVADTAYVPSVLVRHRWTRGTHGNLKLRWIGIQSSLRYWRKWGGLW